MKAAAAFALAVPGDVPALPWSAQARRARPIRRIDA
jgi:hypothetical protein